MKVSNFVYLIDGANIGHTDATNERKQVAPGKFLVLSS